METNPYLSMFIDESKEHLQAINDSLLTLENDPGQMEQVQQIFRSAHTLKGMAATMGFEDLAALTHQMENVLDLVRNGNLQMQENIFDVLFQSLDCLESMVDDITQGGSGKADVSQIVSALSAIASGETATADPVQHDGIHASQPEFDLYQIELAKQAIASGNHVYIIRVKLEDTCVMKAVRAYMVIEALGKHGEIFMTVPDSHELEQDFDGIEFHVGLITSAAKEQLEADIIHISEVELAEAQQWSEPAKSESAATVAEQPQTAKQSGQAVQAGRTIRVDIQRLDRVINLFSELLIDRARLESLAKELGHAALTETVEHMSRISTELQDTVLNLRMVPVESVFNRFPRMVRDLAKSLGKKVAFIMTGQETELDRTVVEELGDPLVHLLRNSLDHGIEAPNIRKQQGKDEEGKIYLRAYHSGNHVYIEIEDDGNGINREKVLATALKNGVVTEAEANEMSDNDVYQLLFASGFSTADKVSDVSGRGVGLDVVRAKINALGGQVQVTSEMGKGTQFTVELPLTLSIITAMLFQLGKEQYALPLSSVVETALYTDEQLQYVHGNVFVDYRGRLIPVVNIKALLECGDEDVADHQDFTAIIIRKGEQFAAVFVDEIIGQQDIVLKSLGKYLSDVFAISGATILGDGKVALIVDSHALIK